MNTSQLTAFLLATVALTDLATAQFDTEQMDSRGSQSLGNPVIGIVNSSDWLGLGMLRVQLLEAGSSRVVCDTHLGSHGDFMLPAQPIGFYELRVVGAVGEIRYSQELHNASSGYLNIVLERKSQAGEAKMISAARLKHKTTKRAKKELGEAMKAFRSGKRQLAIQHLEVAASDDPECFDALSNLGALYLQDRDEEKAVKWLERAYQIDPSDSANNTNLSAYYALKDDYEKAQSFAEAGLRSDPASSRAHYMLAYSLVKQGKNVETAKHHLEQIQGVFGPARKLLLSLSPK